MSPPLLSRLQLITINDNNSQQRPQQQSRKSILALSMGGGGMGMGAGITTKKKKGNKKNKQKKNVSNFDAAASLLKLEFKYDELCAQSAKVDAKEDDDITVDDKTVTEFVVAIRSSSSAVTKTKKNLKSVSDWVPVAQLCLARPLLHRHEEAEREGIGSIEGFDKELAVTAISYYCRELYQTAVLGSTKFRDVPRQELEYSVEPEASFYKHVEENLKGKKGSQESMGKAEARQILGLVTTTEGDEASPVSSSLDNRVTIKATYRKKIFALHPDRFVGVERTTEEEKATNDEFARVKQAYETLISGMAAADNNGRSWYESLGGKERTDFTGPIKLLSIDDAKNILFPENRITKNTSNDCAIGRLDPELVQNYVMRNQNSN
eukprot:CAMPEP_0194148274 /NCGR_PEP_ID=MMETSP0152-20130528/31294_1 /TAXON_ID=1049557 /ORGANISM="Thalassiothrix antarctica, Strain L6-D1" /LENGTH=378 /DNA_ID=CAMNT_0038849677 /DNA_START=98 /DNA_END=1234 /DNA_ORIENTATION=-